LYNAKNIALAPLFWGVNISTSMAGKSANKDFTFKNQIYLVEEIECIGVMILNLLLIKLIDITLCIDKLYRI
jgi:hypothetical protein